jgi:hypothetical protein
MRLRARVDSNQKDITRELRKIGAFVFPMSQLGKGAPDLLIAFRGKWHCVELKDGAKAPSRRKLTQDEKDWHAEVAGRAPIYVCKDLSEALQAIKSPHPR